MPQRIQVEGMGMLEFPDGMTDDQIAAAIKANAPKPASPARKPVDFQEPWGAPKFVGEMLANVPRSAANFAGGIVDAVSSPIKTASGLMDLAAGGLRNLTPAPLRALIDRADWNPQAAQRATGTADAVGQIYKDRYGGGQNIMQTLRDDPVGAAADLSTVLGLGAGALNMTGRAAPVAASLSAASNATNPMGWAVKGVQAVARPVGSAAATLIGELGTHSGSAGLKTAAETGAKGGQASATFLDNMRGNVPMADLVETAKANLLNMKIEKNAQYAANMDRIKTDASVLRFDGIEGALSKAAGAVSFKGVVKDEKAAAAVQKVAEEVAAWKALNPAEYHTPAGLDALKQKVQALRESIPLENRTARMTVGNVANAIKAEIQQQAPTYSKVMRDYENASNAIDEVTRTLSLGEKAASDTALRKLQSVMRNNANTNYGNRAGLVEQLSSNGADLAPALAGQSLSSWAPRGLGKVAAPLTVGASWASPGLLGLLPLQSPRLMGESAHMLGRGYGLLANENIPPGLLGLGQAGLLGNQ